MPHTRLSAVTFSVTFVPTNGGIGAATRVNVFVMIMITSFQSVWVRGKR